MLGGRVVRSGWAVAGSELAPGYGRSEMDAIVRQPNHRPEPADRVAPTSA
jgi:hypothetical protein